MKPPGLCLLLDSLGLSLSLLTLSFLSDGELIIEWVFFSSLRPTAKSKLRDWFSVVFFFFFLGWEMEKRKNPDRPLCFDPPPDVRCASKERKKKGKLEKWEGVINEVYIYPEGRLVVDSHTHKMIGSSAGWVGG